MTTTFYGTATAYKAYRLERGTDVSALVDATVNAALLVASEFIDANYRNGFTGQKVLLRAQDREWPRVGAYDDWRQTIAVDEIPIEVQHATYEAAIRQLATPGSLRNDVTLGTAIQSVTVEGAVSVTYAGTARVEDMQLAIPAIDAILAPILTGSRGGSRISGATVR